MRATDPVHTITGTYIADTAKAIHFEIHAICNEACEPNKQWFPFSQVSKITKDKNVGCDTLIVSEWILKEKGLI